MSNVEITIHHAKQLDSSWTGFMSHLALSQSVMTESQLTSRTILISLDLVKMLQTFVAQ